MVKSAATEPAVCWEEAAVGAGGAATLGAGARFGTGADAKGAGIDLGAGAEGAFGAELVGTRGGGVCCWERGFQGQGLCGLRRSGNLEDGIATVGLSLC